MIEWSRYQELEALCESGHPAEALVESQKLREGATDAEDVSSLLLGEAVAYRDLGQFGKATEAASEAVSLLPEGHPNLVYAEFVLAGACGNEGKHDLEAEKLKWILSRYAPLFADSEHTELRRDAQCRLISALIHLGHSVEPLSMVNALKTEDLSPEQRGKLLYLEAEAYRLLERTDHAMRLFQEALNWPLDNSMAANAHFEIGVILFDRGNFPQALDEFKAAEALADPNSPDKEHFAKWVKHTLGITGNFDVRPQ
jgi:tetratricopeptide (TPR) repeat protein